MDAIAVTLWTCHPFAMMHNLLDGVAHLKCQVGTSVSKSVSQQAGKSVSCPSTSKVPAREEVRGRHVVRGIR